jgi:putative hydrolase of the HAD superfamily
LIIFDLDDTLIDTTGSITPLKLEQAFYTMCNAGLEVGDPEEALLVFKRLDSGSESAAHTLAEFLEILGADEKYFEMGKEAIYSDLSSDMAVFPLEQAVEVLEDLKQLFTLALVSKGKPHQQFLKLKNSGIDSTIFSRIIFSEEENKKPHYQKILEELGFSPTQTVVCGDRIGRDLVPAKELGCRTIQMKWGRGAKSQESMDHVDFCITKLSQLKRILA